VKREQRLRSPADFRRVRDVARRGWSHPLLVMYVAANDLGCTRVGITVSGRVGKAVLRNRVRRRLREALQARFAQLPKQSDVVVSARPAIATASWADLCAALDIVLARAGQENPR
jgi:ribonuclease P protein component